MYLLFKVSSFMKKKEKKRNIGIVVSIKMTIIPYVKMIYSTQKFSFSFTF